MDPTQEPQQSETARGLIVFVDVEPMAEMQVARSEVFGPLQPRAFKNVPTAGNDKPGIVNFDARPDDPTCRFRSRRSRSHRRLRAFRPAGRTELRRHGHLHGAHGRHAAIHHSDDDACAIVRQLLCSDTIGGLGLLLTEMISDRMAPVVGAEALGIGMLIIPACLGVAALAYAFAIVNLPRDGNVAPAERRAGS